MKLDKSVEPLAKDTRVEIRPRSALGLKYVELVPGRARAEYQAGDTIPLRFASEPLELEDVLATFDGETRVRGRAALEGFGDAFAGRGASLNSAVAALNPLFGSLTPVMDTLGDPGYRARPVLFAVGAHGGAGGAGGAGAGRSVREHGDQFRGVGA